MPVGNWYYGFDCIECGKRFACFEDKTNGVSPSKFEGPGHLQVKCPHCNAERLYSTQQVIHFKLPAT